LRIFCPHLNFLEEKILMVIPTPYTLVDQVAIINLSSRDEELPTSVTRWGTKNKEHRLNPDTILSLYKALLNIAKETFSIKSLLVTANGKYFCNGFDLKWIQHINDPKQTDELQKTTELVIALLLKFPMPTVAAVNGHACAAGAMLALAFDKIVMNSEKGFCFVPGIDLGLTYSPGMTELMKAKLPVTVRTDFIVFGERFDGNSLHSAGVCEVAPSDQVFSAGLKLATGLRVKSKYPKTMSRIKETLYHEAISALEVEIDQQILNPQFIGMGFDIVEQGQDRPSGSFPPPPPPPPQPPPPPPKPRAQIHHYPADGSQFCKYPIANLSMISQPLQSLGELTRLSRI